MATTTRGRRADLRDFLTQRRAALRPQDVGLPATPRRRTPGLRREEVAVLAGVGVTWYTWLEQGRPIGVTTGVLDGVAAALRLDDAERAHLYHLAGHRPPPAAPDRDAGPPPELRAILDHWLPNPAYVVDRHWNYLAANRAADRVLGYDRRPRNCLEAFFTDPRVRARVPEPDACARGLVSAFRANAARYPEDREFDAIVAGLRADSPEFDALWRRHDVRGAPPRAKRLRHPTAGELRFTLTALNPAGRPDLRLLMMLPDEETAGRLARVLAG